MRPRLIAVVLGLLALWSGVCAEQLRFDFETGDLQGWRVIEGGFDKLVCDRAVFHNTGQPYNKQGKYFLSTLEQSDNRPSDRFVGVVESPVFLLQAPEMRFIVGGGAHRNTYAALCTAEDGQEQLQARGKNTETMQTVRWTAPELVGKRVFLRIVDGNTGGWGHTTFDDFQAEGTIDATATELNFAEKKDILEALRLAGMPDPGTPATLRAAIVDLVDTFGERYRNGQVFLARLEALEGPLASENLPVRRQALKDFRELQREALIANPLVSGQPILYVARRQYAPDHHNTATMFQTGEINTASFRGGSALKTIDFGAGGTVRTLLELPQGVVRDPDVYFDGARILVSLRRDIKDDAHIHEIAASGGEPRQLTFAPGVSDIDPLYLPGGDIAFSSTREPKYCMCNRHIMANLFRMHADGTNIHQIGKSTLMEGHGSLTPDGRILYNRWEYVDRNFGDAQGLWTVYPDGTNHAVYWGNNTASPGAVVDPRAIPGTGQVVCTFTSCHDRPWGAIAIVDRSLAIDGRRAVVRIWPPSAIERVDIGGIDSYVDLFPKYEDPYPLADPNTGAGAGKYFLCSRMTGSGEQMGICLLDVFGNELLLHSEEPGCFDPMLLAARQRPPELPTRRNFDDAPGYFYVVDVYRGTHMAGVERGDVKFLRVVESPEKRQWVYPWWGGQGSQSPAMGWHDFNNKRILGTVPVEEDGSVYFEVPSDRFVYFQLLDAEGMMVQSMRSGTMVQSGEYAGCVGCHEDRHMTPPAKLPRMSKATSRAPRKLDSWRGEPRLFSYTAEVQPVFDRLCVSCHDYGKPAGKVLNLAGDRDLFFNASYNELWRRGFIKAIGAGPAQIQQARSWGSHASKIVATLRAGHVGDKLTPEDLERIVTWIDINAPYYPTYASAYPGNLSGRSPLDDEQLERLEELTGVPLRSQAAHNANHGPQVSFERPELSPCLSAVREKNPEAYLEALAIIEAGKRMLTTRPRADMEGFVACEVDLRREEKYARRLAIEKRNRAAVRAGERVPDEGEH